MPNAFAYLMLLSWPLVAVVLFRTLTLHNALIWTFLGGYLILPSAVGIAIPMLPDLDKSLIPTLSAVVLCLIYAPRAKLMRDWDGRTGRLVIIALAAVLIGTPILSVLQNSEPVIVGLTFLPGLGIYDAFSMISGVVVSVAPFWLGLRYLNTTEAHKALLKAFVFGALVYSLPALFEVRMSPQLHIWIYGFFQHDFGQHIRLGGYRPVVFLSHGLLLGIFLCLALLSALILWREALREGKKAAGWLVAALWLAVVLVLSKNLGALGIAVALSVLVIFTGRRIQTTFALAVAVAVLLYPMLRGAGLVPVDEIYEIAMSVDEDRAGSLKFRFDNEDALLAHANEKPIVGWGSWGRNQLYDDVTGRMVSVTDGIWVILIGVYGWLGYIAHFGLLTAPILFYVVRRSSFGSSLITPGLMLVLSAALIDFIPNAGLVNYVWLLAGGLTGFVLWRPIDAEATGQELPIRRAYPAEVPSSGTASWVMTTSRAAPRRPRTERRSS